MRTKAIEEVVAFIEHHEALEGPSDPSNKIYDNITVDHDFGPEDQVPPAPNTSASPAKQKSSGPSLGLVLLALSVGGLAVSSRLTKKM